MAQPINAAAGAAALRVSTGAIRGARRVAHWREEFARQYLRLDIETRDPEHFRADATIRMLPGLKIASCTVSASVWRRTHGMIDTGAEEVALLFCWNQATMLSQRGRSFDFSFGDAATCLQSEPADLALPTAMGRHVGVIVPVARLDGLLRGGDLTPLRIPRNNEPLRLLWSYLGRLDDNVTLANPQLLEVVVTHVHDLIALAIGVSGDGAEIANGRGLRAARLRAVKADVRANLASADLSVAAVAGRQGITPRYLHLLFEDEGTTFSQFVLDQRLELVRHELADPRADHRSIAAIAYAAGFGDLSYFNRAFRNSFGMTPREARKGGARD
jgi:AraC-like DNA-binding protein